MRLTFKYPVYPTQDQETTLLRWLEHLCELQNSARHDRIVALETEDRFVSLNKQEKLLTIARKKYDDFREVSQDMQCHVLKRNDKAFANFRRRCENGASKKGYLRYKKRVRSLTWSLRKYPKVVHRKTKDAAKQTIEEELTSDVLEIMTVFCAKLYGRRSHKSKKMAQEIEKIVSEEKQQLELHFGTPHTENSPESE